MIKQGFKFQYEIPDNWSETDEGKQYIYHGRNGEELIISGVFVAGHGEESELQLIRERLFQNAVQSVNNAATDPDLLVINPLQRDESVSLIPSWTLQAQTRDGKILFVESIFQSKSAVLLITFEAPNNEESKLIYKQLLQSIKEK